MLLSSNVCFAEKENPSENREGHGWDERCGHQLDPTGDSQCHEYVHFDRNDGQNTCLRCDLFLLLLLPSITLEQHICDLYILSYRQGFP